MSSSDRPEDGGGNLEFLVRGTSRPDHSRGLRGNPQITADLRRWAGHLRAVLDSPGGGEAFTVLLTYIELVSDAQAGELRDLAASLGPDAEEAYVATAEMLRTEGAAETKAQDVLKVIDARPVRWSKAPDRPLPGFRPRSPLKAVRTGAASATRAVTGARAPATIRDHDRGTSMPDHPARP